MFIHRRKGFTLVEILVVIGILSVVGTVAGSVLISSFRSYNKSDAQNNLEQQGNYALAFIMRRLRNARRVEPDETACTTLDRSSGIILTTFKGEQESFNFNPQCNSGSEYANGCVTYNSNVRDTLNPSQPLTEYKEDGGVNVVFDTLCQDAGHSWFEITPDKVTVQIYLEQSDSLPAKQDYEVDTTLNASLSLRNY